MKRRYAKITGLLFLGSALLSLHLPVFSVSEQGIIRGYQILGLSVFSLLVGLSMLLLLLITVCPLPRCLQCAVLLVVLAVSTICYAEAAWLGRLWLQRNGGTFIRHHFGLVVFPQMMMAAVATAWRPKRPSKRSTYQHQKD